METKGFLRRATKALEKGYYAAHIHHYIILFWTTEQEKQLTEIIILHNCVADREEEELFGFPTSIIDSSKLAQSEMLHTI